MYERRYLLQGHLFTGILDGEKMPVSSLSICRNGEKGHCFLNSQAENIRFVRKFMLGLERATAVHFSHNSTAFLKTVCSSETSVATHRTYSCNNPEDQNLNIDLNDNVKTYVIGNALKIFGSVVCTVGNLDSQDEGSYRASVCG
jgi:hypothetical protein